MSVHGARLATALGFTLLWGCGGVETAGSGGPALEPFLVEVTDSMPTGDLRLVSVSSLGFQPDGSGPHRPGAADVATMRAAAAAHGAELLVLETVDNPWRHAFYGFGYVRAAADTAGELPGCVHPEAIEARDAAAATASRCLRRRAAARPGLAGRLTVLFQVDAHGDIYRAGATPDSSRDTQVQRCAMQAIYDHDYGAHRQLLCALRLEASL